MRLLLLLLLVAVAVNGAAAAPVFIFDHRNIIMAVHGLMDHLTVPSLLDGALRAAKAAQWQMRRENPRLADTDLSQLSGAELESHVRLLWHYLDHNRQGDSRLFLEEFAAFLLAGVETAMMRATSQAETAFDGFATASGKTSLSWEDVSKHYPNKLQIVFTDADANGDNSLNRTEFRDFMFPEYSAAVARRFSEPFLAQADADKDGFISDEEFLSDQLKIKSPGQNHYSAEAYDHRAEVVLLRDLFRTNVDVNKDGKLDLAEIQVLLHPAHFIHAVSEAYEAFVMADENRDHELSLAELLNRLDAIKSCRLLSFEHEAKRDADLVYRRIAERVRRLASIRRDEL
eukprot:m.212491 g.212491  ORF g.212491 m.212491 type:complete len:344 (-) comp20511_c0_seq1:237-1268(-)